MTIYINQSDVSTRRRSRFLPSDTGTNPSRSVEDGNKGNESCTGRCIGGAVVYSIHESDTNCTILSVKLPTGMISRVGERYTHGYGHANNTPENQGPSSNALHFNEEKGTNGSSQADARHNDTTKKCIGQFCNCEEVCRLIDQSTFLIWWE